VYTYKDNKAHGWVDMRRALAVSSNVYFYTIGGGYGDQKGLGIGRIEQYTKMFGLGDVTGINMQGEAKGNIPSPEWKEKVFNGDDWRIGDTYNTSIGQYGFQVTPIEMARAVAALANSGTLVTPSITEPVDPATFQKLSFQEEDMQVVREGMRMVVTEASGQLLNSLPFSVAAKTGTAQVGIQKRYVNAWMVGFFPYEEPRYAFVFLMEHGPGGEAVVGASRAALPFFTQLAENMPEYVGL
jgi:penicillin-binding protein 2